MWLATLKAAVGPNLAQKKFSRTKKEVSNQEGHVETMFCFAASQNTNFLLHDCSYIYRLLKSRCAYFMHGRYAGSFALRLVSGFAGSPADQMATLPLVDAEVDEQDLQAAPKNAYECKRLPCLETPSCLPLVLNHLCQHPPPSVDPTAQHKKEFKERKAGQWEWRLVSLLQN